MPTSNQHFMVKHPQSVSPWRREFPRTKNCSSAASAWLKSKLPRVCHDAKAEAVEVQITLAFKSSAIRRM
jgi:hypothetical protein